MRDGTILRSQIFSINNGISIHPPHAGRDDRYSAQYLVQNIFQSTRPMRDGTAKSDNT